MGTHGGPSRRRSGHDAARQAVILSRFDLAMAAAAMEILSETAADLVAEGIAPEREMIDTMADLLSDREPYAGLWQTYREGRISPRAAMVAACIHRRNARRIGPS